MRRFDEYCDPLITKMLVDRIRAKVTQPWVVVEICGGQSHTLMRHGIHELLQSQVELVHGPGCPICVTPIEIIDQAIEIALRPDAVLVTYDAMLRVPGSRLDLCGVKANGGDVRTVYSPMEAVRIARTNPSKKVVFFAIGFETTAAANAMAVWRAHQDGLTNFFELVSQVMVPPAIRMFLNSPGNRVQGFVAPGQVCSVVGYWDYKALVDKFRVPIVVGGPDPVDLLEAILMLVTQLEKGEARAENQYSRSVDYEGNEPAQIIVDHIFEAADRQWRGIGIIPMGGLKFRPEFAAYDAEGTFGKGTVEAVESPECMSSPVLQGVKKPVNCEVFARLCEPAQPAETPMVDAEGACAAYSRQRRHPAKIVSIA